MTGTTNLTDAPKRARPQGVLQLIKAYFSMNRIGDLLVLEGRLDPEALRMALMVAKTNRRRIGQVLIDEKLIRRHELYAILGKQWSVRTLAWSVAMFMSIGPMMPRHSRADERSNYAIEALAYNNSSDMSASRNQILYPALFGSLEKKSDDLSAFTKWTSMFQRYSTQTASNGARLILADFETTRAVDGGISLVDLAKKVDVAVNKVEYVDDKKNWGKSDYWETPNEFFARGGDCEDFAIAKYMTLKSLGVPEERLRIAIVHDLQKNIPHAILIVYTDAGQMVLDNQSDVTRWARDLNGRYKPIFSINAESWWLHTAPPSGVMVATAAGR